MSGYFEIPTTAECEQCGQTCVRSLAWTVRGLCDLCRADLYGPGTHAQPSRLFDSPAPMAGQTEAFNPDGKVE